MLSGGLFGIALNFRSDYYYFMICFITIQLIYDFIKKRNNYRYILLWTVIVFGSLVPWGIYTYQRTGYFLTTSTNGGHVLFVGLGQLPNNLWGITPSDGDPLMHQILKEKQGNRYMGSLNYAANQILINQWKIKVLESPVEFFKKCAYAQLLYWVEPFNHGQLYRSFISKQQWEDEISEIKALLVNFRIKEISKKFFSFSSIYLWIVSVIVIMAIAFNAFFWFYLLKSLYKNWRDLIYNDLFIITICIIGYQVVLQTVAYYLSYYNTNIYIFYAILLAMLLDFNKQKNNNIKSH
jgi:hypothetical protein